MATAKQYIIEAKFRVARTYVATGTSEQDVREHPERWEEVEEITLDRTDLDIQEQYDDSEGEA